MVTEKLFNYKGVDYIVSSDGKIYSTSNVGRGKYHKEIKQRKDADGYWCVTLGKNDQRTRVKIHRIIALAFIENPYNLPEVDHIDNNKDNNCVENLQWISSTDNKKKISFEVRSESHKGRKNGRAILSETDIIEIRKLYDSGYTKNEIAKMYNRGWSTIYNIISGNTWKGIN